MTEQPKPLSEEWPSVFYLTAGGEWVPFDLDKFVQEKVHLATAELRAHEYEQVKALQERMRELEGKTCEWSEDPESIMQTGCGYEFAFEDSLEDILADKSRQFCLGCGGKITRALKEQA